MAGFLVVKVGVGAVAPRGKGFNAQGIQGAAGDADKGEKVGKAGGWWRGSNWGKEMRDVDVRGERGQGCISENAHEALTGHG